MPAKVGEAHDDHTSGVNFDKLVKNHQHQIDSIKSLLDDQMKQTEAFYSQDPLEKVSPEENNSVERQQQEEHPVSEGSSSSHSSQEEEQLIVEKPRIKKNEMLPLWSKMKDLVKNQIREETQKASDNIKRLKF